MHSILHLFGDKNLGIVFPQHLFEIRGILNWGYDYELARGLMRRIGTDIDKNLVLEFPSGSMFWGRSAAIRPLLDLGLTYDDFPDEGAQVDGTIAHAIERIVLLAAETVGLEWSKVVRADLYPLGATVLPVARDDDLARHRLKVFQPCLTPVDAEVPPYARQMTQVRPIATYPSHNPRPRLTLIVPTVNPHQAFGGIATALKLFTDCADAFGPDLDRRIVATDADIEAEAYAALPDFVAVPFAASLDSERRVLVDARERAGGRLDMRPREIIMATAWWTAELARSLEHQRARYHGGRHRFIYLIQDDEPYFQGWSTKWARAAATYAKTDDMIAVINSEELFAAMTAKHRFETALCLPYEINAKIARSLAPRPRERIILAYARPHVDRNAFELLCDSLVLWQQRDPIRASRWRVVFLGETFEAAHAYPVQNLTVDGKVTLDVYADYLNRASVGLSFMISPHPSYPPLEMAEAGVRVITNSYPGKDLRHRFPDIVSLDVLQPETVAQAIEDAVIAAEPCVGTVVSHTPGIRQTVEGLNATAGAIVELLGPELT